MERNRKEAVRLGLKSGWPMRSLKKVGGADHVGGLLLFDEPQGLARVPAGHEYGLHGKRSGDEHAVQEAGYVGQGGRKQHGVGGGETADLDVLADLVGDGGLGVDHALGDARRAGGEHDEGPVVGVGRSGRIGVGGAVGVVGGIEELVQAEKGERMIPLAPRRRRRAGGRAPRQLASRLGRRPRPQGRWGAGRRWAGPVRDRPTPGRPRRSPHRWTGGGRRRR